MQSDNSQLVEQLAWEGVVSGRTALALFVVIALPAIWKRQAPVGKRRVAMSGREIPAAIK